MLGIDPFGMGTYLCCTLIWSLFSWIVLCIWLDRNETYAIDLYFRFNHEDESSQEIDLKIFKFQMKFLNLSWAWIFEISKLIFGLIVDQTMNPRKLIVVQLCMNHRPPIQVTGHKEDQGKRKISKKTHTTSGWTKTSTRCEHGFS